MQIPERLGTVASIRVPFTLIAPPALDRERQRCSIEAKRTCVYYPPNERSAHGLPYNDIRRRLWGAFVAFVRSVAMS